jgi:hypothetical protein
MTTFDQLGKKIATLWPSFVGMPSIEKQPWEARFALMAETTEDSSPAGRRWNPVAVTIALLLLAPLALILLVFIVLAGLFVHSAIVPAHSASTTIPDVKTELTLRFYYTWDESTDSGRYLYVDTPRGRIRVYMTAFDWAHNARTSIYLTPERKIAILGPAADDYLLSLDSLTAKALAAKPAAGASENWTYLGAFDFEVARGSGRLLRFVSAAEQAECIPMLMDVPYEAYKIRTSARQLTCPYVETQSAAK